MSDRPVDQVLVNQARKGDRQAFELLFTKYQQRVYNLVLRFVKDRVDAMDVTQETFIRVWRALPGFRGDSAFYTWLYRIAVNTAKNHLAMKGRHQMGGDVNIDDVEQTVYSDVLMEQDTPERLLSAERLRQAIEASIAGLPDELRTVIILRETKGLSYEEIAAAMDCPVGTVRSRIFRAREAISNALAPLLTP